MTIRRVFSAYDHVDCAEVQLGDVMYRAYLCRVARYIGTNVIGGVAIRVRVMVEQPSGQVELFDSEVTNTNGDTSVNIDSPKMICVGTTLVVCWAQTDAVAATLHMSSLDLLTIATLGVTWSYAGDIPTHTSCLFDLVNVQTSQYLATSATDFIVAHRTELDEYAVHRHEGFDWLSMQWVTTHTTPSAIADSILAAHAYETVLQASVLVTYQVTSGNDESTGAIFTTRFISTNGVETNDTQSFTAIPELVRATQATHLQVAQAQTLLLVEYATNDDLANGDIYIRWVAGVVLTTATTAQASAEMACSNIHLLSRVFGVPGMSDLLTPTMRAFVAVGFKNMGGETSFLGEDPVESGTEWAQSLPMIVALDWTRWDVDLESRPYVVAQMPFTIGDCRVGGAVSLLAQAIGTSQIDARRANHLSHVTGPPDFGPSVKSSTFALATFARAANVGISTGAREASGSKINPFAALVRGWEFDYEDPWLTLRDGRAPPDANWRGVHELAQHQALNVGRHLVLGGSTPVIYDGAQVVELGYAWDPEFVRATSVLLGGAVSGLSEGVYTYVAFYEWPDNFGAVHRSGPSVPCVITLGDPGPDGIRVTLRIRTMTVSLRDNLAAYPDAHSMHIVVYRTVANGSQLYRLHCLDNAFQSVYSVDQTPRNDPTNWYIEINDNLPDETLLAVSDPIPWPLLGAALDPSGFPIPLEPHRVPAGAVMAVWQEHLFIASMERPDEVRWSLALKRANIDYQLAPEFNDVNVVTRDNMGPVTGMAALDESLILFTSDAIYRMVGRVPNDAGADGDLTIQLLASGVGCICPRSVVVTAGEGVFFQSRKGYYQLDRGGVTNYVGADVEDYIADAGMVLSAALKESRHKIYLTCNTADGDPIVLAYDYLAKLWSRALLPGFADDDADALARSVHGVMWRGLDGEVSHVLLQQGGAGYERAASDTPFADMDESGDDIAIPVDVQTGWIHVAGIGGLHRVKSILISLATPNATQITVTLEFDLGGYGTADFTQNIVFAAGTALPLRCRPTVQKCTAFRMRIAETGVTPTTENISITAITLIAGVKTGHSRVPAEQIG